VETVELEERDYITDDALMLAPTESPQAWQHWFDTVMTGRFLRGTCPPASIPDTRNNAPIQKPGLMHWGRVFSF
jgi:hypothetical protein